MYGNIALFPA